jgi:hypothetical protein
MLGVNGARFKVKGTVVTGQQSRQTNKDLTKRWMYIEIKIVV